MKEEEKQNESFQKRPRRILLLIFPFALILLILLLCLFLLRNCKSEKSATFDDLIACLKATKKEYDDGYSPLKDYFASEVSFSNDESNVTYHLQYQKDPFILNKVIENNEGEESYAYQKVGESYYCNESVVNEEAVAAEINNERCGYAYYLSLTLDHFDYLIQNISEMKQLSEDNFLSKEIVIESLSTYSCKLEKQSENEMSYSLSFSFAKNNLEKYSEKTALFFNQNSFAFSR